MIVRPTYTAIYIIIMQINIVTIHDYKMVIEEEIKEIMRNLSTNLKD